MIMNNKKIISVIGDSKASDSSYIMARKVGKILVDNGYTIQCGGLGGIMKGVCEGAKMSHMYTRGCTIAITPSYNRTEVNEYADIVIPTGLGLMRNGVVVNADAVIAIGGGAGTLSEIALAWSMFKLIISFVNIEGWGKNLANQRIDNRNRYPMIPEDCVYGVSSPEEMIIYLNKYINRYDRQYKGIYWHG